SAVNVAIVAGWKPQASLSHSARRRMCWPVPRSQRSTTPPAGDGGFSDRQPERSATVAKKRPSGETASFWHSYSFGWLSGFGRSNERRTFIWGQTRTVTGGREAVSS